MVGKWLAVFIPAVLRFAGEQKQIPGETGGGGVRVLFAPANDLAMVIVVARVGGINGMGVATLVVIGKSGIDLTTVRVYRHPLRAVHSRRSQPVGGGTGIDQYLTLIGKAVSFCQPVFTVHQWQPNTAAIAIETRHIENATVEQVTVVLPVALDIATFRHKLVQVFATGIIAGVKHQAAILTQ